MKKYQNRCTNCTSVINQPKNRLFSSLLELVYERNRACVSEYIPCTICTHRGDENEKI